MITVDTHIIIWDALQPELLSKKAQAAINTANTGDGIIFCEISLWEIAMLMRKDRLKIDVSFMEFINLLKAANHYVFTGMSPEIAELSVTLPEEINHDPADRIICATALQTNTPLLTADKNLLKSNIIKTIC
ncbi:MAG TPA: type II toxin-antitoxin system VapC family toxin [bacterium]|nr:type II toxin-antitoxin system VapC family toxin [bacterium]HPN44831.1 type II toxin-antitoxin system VapC family toxin [bacterium]